MATMSGSGSGQGGTVTQVLTNIHEARLTIVSGDPVNIPTQELLAADVPTQRGYNDHSTLLYLTPYKGNKILLQVDGKWVLKTLVECSIDNSTLQDGADITIGAVDVFAYWDGTAVQLELGPVYGQYSRPAGRIVLQDGIPVKQGDATRKLVGTTAGISAGNHTPPYFYYDGTAVRGVCNLYNKIPKHGMGVEGFASSPGALSEFILTAAANGNWQIPLFGGSAVVDYSYPGHLRKNGDGIYLNWICAENQKIRLTAKIKMANDGATQYGAGICVNYGDDEYNPARVVCASETTLGELEDEITTEFPCVAGLFGSHMAFFAEGGSKLAKVQVSDAPRGASADVVLTSLHAEGLF